MSLYDDTDDLDFDTDDILAEDAPPAPVEDDLEDSTDFDAFWRKRTKKAKPAPKVRIMGDEVELPRALPLQFMLEQTKQARGGKAAQDPIILAVIIFGERQVKKWARAGMDTDQFGVLVAWASAKLQGADVTLEEVAEKLEEHVAKGGALGED